MFYLYRNEVCVTPVGITVKEYKKLEEFCTKGRKTNDFFIDVCKYIFFVYHKVDSLGNKNLFNAYPINERREVVIEKYELFNNILHHSEKRHYEYSDIYNISEIVEFLDFYKKACYSETERTREVFRAKIEHWRGKYSNLSNTPEEDKDFEAALRLAQKNLQEYETKVLLESSTDGEAAEGIPLYLFEIPESQKPMHHRLKYGDLKKQ